MESVESMNRLKQVIKTALLLLLHVGTSQAQAQGVDAAIDPQTQIYIVAGCLGGVVFILILLILALALSVSKIKDQLSASTRYSPSPSNPQARSGDIFAYDNGAYNSREAQDRRQGEAEMQERVAEGNDDLEKMGYSVYNGRQENPPNRFSHPSHAGYESRAPIRATDGVVPLHDGRPRHQEKR